LSNGLTNYVYVQAGAPEQDGRRTRLDPTYDIQRTRWNKVGYVVCRTGQYSGTTCGKVVALGKRSSYEHGNVGSLGYLRTFGCDPDDPADPNGVILGDSGGPIYKRHAAFGVLSGRLNRNHCMALFSGAKVAESEMNITIRTTR
jgi:hypothetical protein